MGNPRKKESAPAPAATAEAPHTGELRMRLHGYIPLTASELDAIWDGGIIAFDTNVVGRLYDVSPATLDEFLNLLHGMKEQIWLPIHVCTEYLRHRTEKIRFGVGAYGDLKSKINSIKSDLESSKNHPFIGKELLNEFSAVVEKVRKELDDQCLKVKSLLESDSILDRVEQLFEGRLGKGFTPAEQEKICEEGVVRFQARIPPGFEDRGKPANKFGDLIIWKELIRHASETGRPMILVTQDGKTDWWKEEDGQKLTHPDLRQEFKDLSGQLFCLYSMDDFMREAQRRGKKISDAAIEEVKEIAEEERKEAEIADRIESFNASLIAPVPIVSGTGTFVDAATASAVRRAEVLRPAMERAALGDLARIARQSYELYSGGDRASLARLSLDALAQNPVIADTDRLREEARIRKETLDCSPTRVVQRFKSDPSNPPAEDAGPTSGT